MVRSSVNLNEVIAVERFVRLAHHRVNRLFRHDQLRHHDSIYTRNWQGWFNRREHPRVPYTLVSNYYDDPVVNAPKSPTLARWFAVQAELEHPSVHRIPVALKEGRIPFMKRHQGVHPRRFFLYMNFKQHTGERVELHKRLESLPWVTVGTYHKPDMDTYFHELAQSVFVISPPGKGMDCYRTWEAIAMGAIPVVRRSYLNELYRGLPVVIVDSFEEVTEPFLARELDRLSHQHMDMRPMTMAYWASRIHQMGVHNA